MSGDAEIVRNLSTVRRRIDAAAHRAHRHPDTVTLVAVSKTFDAAAVRAAAQAGQRVFGENRIQEAEAKAPLLADLDLEWHLIGHLQTNKVKKAVALFPWIQSVDRVALVDKLAQAAAGLPTPPRVLVQVDLAHEATKHGAADTEVRSVIDAILAAPALRLEGLMTIPPYADDPEHSRPWFVALRTTRDRLVRDGVPPSALRHLSMGMSGDFEVAIEEGATIVRVGTAIFGRRPAPALPDA